MTLRNIEVSQEGAVTKVWFHNINSSFTQRFLITSDRHHDSIYCNRDLELKHLKEAKDTDAYIIDVGDLLDAMQGRYDKRRSYTDLRPEYKDGAYYDLIVKDAAKFYEPFAENFLLLGRGNHDNGVIKHANTDVLSNLAFLLNQKRKTPLCVGGYGGWIILHFDHGEKGGNRSSVKIKYHHGSGGEAPVTRGVIQTNRQMVYIPDADVIINAHSHNEYIMDVKRERISEQGVLYFDICTHIRTPGYKNDYADGSMGWEVERGGVPKPQGCVWLDISMQVFNGKTYRASKCAYSSVI